MASSSSSSSSISLMASQTLILQNPTFFRPSILPFSNSIHKSTFSSSKPLRFRFSSTNPKKALILNSISPSIPPPALSPNSPAIAPLTGATRTVTTLLAIAVTVSKLFAQKFTKFAVNSNLSAVAGPLFFATMSGGRPGRLHTPLTVVAAGMAKWLDIYSGVLLVRVLLSWFPNIPWDRQPLSAIRDLCDPYLNLFRNIIPPVFDTLDVSPLLAFAVLGLLSGIMTSSKMI